MFYTNKKIKIIDRIEKLIAPKFFLNVTCRLIMF